MKGLEKIRELVSGFLRSKEPYKKAVNEFIRELQKALIRADVNVKIVFELTKKIREKALESEPPPGILRNEWFIKIVYDCLTELFGGEAVDVLPKKLPWVIMLVGIQGSGKTTTAAKLALYFKRKGYRPGLITTDTYRPAAYEQLEQLAKQILVPFFGDKNSKDPVDIAVRGMKYLLSKGVNVIIIDTAGRHGYGEEEKLLLEMQELAKAIKPDEVTLVIDAYMGQKAYDLARRFHERVPIGSIIITKLDGTAKGGGAISAVAATGAKIKFIGDGEKLEDFEEFNPRKFVARILGLGDLETLLNKFRAIEESKKLQERLERAFITGKISLRDVYTQLKSIRKLGPLRKIIQLIPGLSLLTIEDEMLRLSEEKIDRWLSILESMTYEELDNPSIIDRRRMRRISIGSGTTIEDVKELLNYYEMLKRMIKDIKRRRGLLKKMGIERFGI